MPNFYLSLTDTIVSEVFNEGESTETLSRIKGVDTEQLKRTPVYLKFVTKLNSSTIALAAITCLTNSLFESKFADDME